MITERGGCSVVEKAKNAQEAGAKAIIIVNSLGGCNTDYPYPVSGKVQVQGADGANGCPDRALPMTPAECIAATDFGTYQTWGTWADWPSGCFTNGGGANRYYSYNPAGSGRSGARTLCNVGEGHESELGANSCPVGSTLMTEAEWTAAGTDFGTYHGVGTRTDWPSGCFTNGGGANRYYSSNPAGAPNPGARTLCKPLHNTICSATEDAASDFSTCDGWCLKPQWAAENPGGHLNSCPGNICESVQPLPSADDDACSSAGGNPSDNSDRYCDTQNNIPACNWDGGDCCAETCIQNPPSTSYTCGGIPGVSPAYSCMDVSLSGTLPWLSCDDAHQVEDCASITIPVLSMEVLLGPPPEVFCDWAPACLAQRGAALRRLPAFAERGARPRTHGP